MQRKFLSNLILIVLLNLLVKPFYLLGIDAEVQNRVGEQMYGNYFALLNFTFLLNIFLDVGTTNYNTRTIAQSPALLQKSFNRLLTLRVGFFVFYAVVTLFMGVLVQFNSYEFYLLGILIFNQFLVATIQFTRSNFGGLHLFKTDAFISILDRSLLIIFCALLLWGRVLGDDFQIEWFVYAQTLAYGLTAIIGLLLLKSEVGKIKWQFKKLFSLVIIKKSFPYALLIFLMMMYNRLDAVMLERLLPNGDVEAGKYAQGFRILDAVNMFALLFAGLLLPIFARMIKQKEDIQGMMQLGYKLLGAISIVVAISCFGLREAIIDLRYPDAWPESSKIFGWLILSFIPVSLTYVFGTLLTANGSLRALNQMAIAGLVLNVALNFGFIHYMQAEGAAIATFITQWVTAIIQIVLVYRVFKYKPNWGVILRLYGLVVLMVLMIIGFEYSELNLHVLVSLVGMWLIGAVCAFSIGLLRPADVLRILKNRSSEVDEPIE